VRDSMKQQRADDESLLTSTFLRQLMLAQLSDISQLVNGKCLNRKAYLGDICIIRFRPLCDDDDEPFID
jgi:hypothetical protein